MHAELEACQRAVEKACGVTPRHYRPPVGLMNHAVVPAARDLGMDIVAWSIRSFDTVCADPAASVIRRLHPGAIVLLHDGGRDVDQVLATTARILDAAADMGLKAVAL